MIAVSSSGRSFRALARYLAAGRSGHERDRVAWSVGRHLPTNDPEVAAKLMRATAQLSQRVEQPVYHLAISFDPKDAGQLTRATMEAVANRVLDRLGLGNHQAILVAHQDRTHPHVHIMVNRIHPTTGLAWERWKDQVTIQAVLREQERVFGLTITPGSLAETPGHQPPEPREVTTGERRAAERRGEPAFISRVRTHLQDYRDATSWRDLEALLADDGLRITRKGQGLIITDGTYYVKASRVARDLSLKQLEQKFGTPHANRIKEGPVSAHIARVARALRQLDRSAAQADERYRVRLQAGRERRRLAAWEAAGEQVRQRSAELDRGLGLVYRNPAMALEQFTALAQTQGADLAARQFLEAPEQFGVLKTHKRPWTLGLDVFPDDREARHAATRLPSLIEALEQARNEAPTSHDVALLRETVEQLDEVLRAAPRQRLDRLVIAELESTAARGMSTFTPDEVRHLQRLVTAPQFALAVQTKAAAREIVLGREDRERS